MNTRGLPVLRRRSPTRQRAFAFLYSLGVLAVVGAFILAAVGFSLDPGEIQRRAIIDDLAYYSALSGLNYGRDYVQTLCLMVQQRTCTAPISAPTFIRDQMEPWCGGQFPATQCLNGGGSPKANSFGQTSISQFQIGSVCFFPTNTEKARLSFQLQLNTNLEHNYYFWGDPNEPCNPEFTVAPTYPDPPEGILYRFTSTGTVQVPDAANAGAWAQVAQRTMYYSFTISNDPTLQNSPPCANNWYYPTFSPRFEEVTQ